MTVVELHSAARGTDGAWLAAADVAGIGARLDIPYRLVGGISVTLLAHRHGVADLVPDRETADADMAVSSEICADPRLLPALRALGYEREDGSRLTRWVEGRELVIDLLTPSYTGRMVSNQTCGDFTVDEVPGLSLALAVPPTQVTVRGTLSDGASVTAAIALPDVRAALCIKAFAYRDRLAARDALDIRRLLEAALAAGHSAADWGTRATWRDAAHVLHTSFVSPGGGGARRFRAAELARVQAIIAHLVPPPARTHTEEGVGHPA